MNQKELTAFTLPFKKLLIEEEKEDNAAPYLLDFGLEDGQSQHAPLEPLIIPHNVPDLNNNLNQNNSAHNQQISMPLFFADNAFKTVLIEQADTDNKSNGNGSLEIEDEMESEVQSASKSQAPSPQVSLTSGSPAYTEQMVQNSSGLKQPQCFLNIDAPSDKKVEVASQAESSEDKQESSLGTHKDKSDVKINLQNSSSSAKKQISPFISVKTLLMKKSPFMHLKKSQKKKSNATHTNMQLYSGSASKISDPPSAAGFDGPEQ